MTNSGADSVYFLGSAKFSNEGSYLFRKFGAFWGTNSVDHQARICHSTTVAGVANTWGYGAMTNSYNDIRNSKTIVFVGSNAAEAHPVSLQHILTGKEINRANVIVFDPRFTRTAAHATEYVRIRSGTDIPIIWGMMWHIFENGWEDKEFIAQRVFGMDDVRAEVAKWTPDEVERVTGIPGEQLRRVAETFATQKPATFIWCMGGTQHTVGTANVRAYCNLLLATGNVGIAGGGANIFRGHCNVQGATDLGVDIVTLPLYYGLTEGAWKHWSRVWEVPYDYFVSRFDEVPAKDDREARTREQNMQTSGIPSTRWFDATLMNAEQIDQRDRLRAMIVFGHGGNTVPRMPEVQAGMNALDLLVVADPHPTTFAALNSRTDNTYLLPICTQLECAGSRTASNRSIQWGEKIVEPIFESATDYWVMLPPGREARLLRADVQEHRDGGRKVRTGARTGIRPARDQPRRMVDRLLRSVAGAAEGAYGQSGQVRHRHAARAQGRARSRRRLLRPAVALLGNARAESSGHADPLQHASFHRRGRWHIPGALRCREGRGEPARGRQLLRRQRDPGRLSPVHHGGAQAARLGRRSHAGRTGENRGAGRERSGKDRRRSVGPPT